MPKNLIKDKSHNRHRKRTCKSVQKPFDLIYYSDEEWEKENFLIINEAKRNGEVIFPLKETT